ncbi:MAG: tetratricopeptide repeat protein [Acutalibacteraceae bacterium]|jgi:tetratricopeptide (TPR) repeat protein
MNTDRSVLQPEDYVEPRCLLCDEPYGVETPVKSVPQQRIIEKMDDYMSRRDYAGAERHLLYWLEEARLGRDQRGELMLRNELVGHYRKAGDKDKAVENAARALELLDELAFAGTVSAATTYVNVATAYNAFGMNEPSLELFEKAKAVYESVPRTAPQLLGGLYNNMALVLVQLERFEEAFALYDKALSVMAAVPGGALEQAITYLNMADAVRLQTGMEQGEGRIFELVDKAWELLDGFAGPRDGYYAFVCEKCAPSFSYYGYFMAASELTKRSKEIYERT